jgi:hypothetical protein
MAPRINVSSISATAMPELKPTAKMRKNPATEAAKSGSSTRRPLSSKNAAPAPAESTPTTPHLRLRATKMRHGSP